MDPQITLFERSSIYQSWTFDPKKCVFDRSLAARRRYVFAKLTDPLISTVRGCLDYATPKMCTGCCCTVAKRPKIRPSSPSSDGERTHVFVAHTKCPSGNNCRLFSPELLFETVSVLYFNCFEPLLGAKYFNLPSQMMIH